jgi:hypothetical protein
MSSFSRPDLEELLSTPTQFWREEVQDMRNYFRYSMMSMLQ